MISVAVLWGLAFWLSLPILEPEPLVRLAALIFAAGGCLISCMKAIADGRQVLRGRLVWVLLAFWVWALISVTWSVSPFSTLIHWGSLSLLPLGFLTIGALPNEAQGVKSFALITGVMGALSLSALAVWALVQYYFLPDMLVGGGVRYPFANPNSYGAVLGMGFFAGLAVALSSVRAMISRAAFGFSLLMWGGMIAIGGHGVLLAFAGALVLCAFSLRKQVLSKKKALAILLVATIAFYGLSSLRAGQLGGMETITGFTSLTQHAGSGDRLGIWQATYSMIQDHMCLGTGFGSFGLMYPSYRLPLDRYSAGAMAHNDPLQFWAEMGVVGVFLFYVFLLGAAMLWLKSQKRDAEGSLSDKPAQILFAGLFMIVLHAHVSFDFYVAPLLVCTGIFLGIWYRTVLPDEDSAQDVRPWQKFIPLVALGAFVFVMQSVHMSVYSVQRAEQAFYDGDMQRFSVFVDQANAQGFNMNAEPYYLAALVPLGIAAEQGALMNTAEKKALNVQVIGLLDQAGQRGTFTAKNSYLRARLYYAIQDYEAVVISLEKALQRDPRYLEARMMLAEFYEGRGRRSEAFDVLKAGMIWRYPRRQPLAYYDKVSAFAQEFGDDDAIALAKILALKASL